jgi:hypothetical protein
MDMLLDMTFRCADYRRPVSVLRLLSRQELCRRTLSALWTHIWFDGKNQGGAYDTGNFRR